MRGFDFGANSQPLSPLTLTLSPPGRGDSPVPAREQRLDIGAVESAGVESERHRRAIALTARHRKREKLAVRKTAS